MSLLLCLNCLWKCLREANRFYFVTFMAETRQQMDARLANTWRLTVNEKKFIETALSSGIRIDGRNPFEYRKLSIKFGRQVLALS